MYTFKELTIAYGELGIARGQTVSLKTDLLKLGPYEKRNKGQILSDHLDALDVAFDLGQSTLVVATSTRHLCNTDIPFNLQKTPSTMGILTEHIRVHDSTVRSFHAFDSYAALGPKADDFCAGNSRFSYGLETPEARLIEDGAVCVSLGSHPKDSISTIHQVESMTNVPYRYIKEYSHPVEQGMEGNITNELFYRHVWYPDCGIKRSGNAPLFEILREKGLSIKEAKLGAGSVYAYDLRHFYELAVEVFLNNPYVWLKEPPSKYPWRV